MKNNNRLFSSRTLREFKSTIGDFFLEDTFELIFILDSLPQVTKFPLPALISDKICIESLGPFYGTLARFSRENFSFLLDLFEKKLQNLKRNFHISLQSPLEHTKIYQIIYITLFHYWFFMIFAVFCSSTNFFAYILWWIS